jgi:hypothetical protein
MAKGGNAKDHYNKSGNQGHNGSVLGIMIWVRLLIAFHFGDIYNCVFVYVYLHNFMAGSLRPQYKRIGIF